MFLPKFFIQVNACTVFEVFNIYLNKSCSIALSPMIDLSSFLTDLTEFQFYMLLISNNLKKQYDGRHFLSYYEWILSQILLFDKWILMFSFKYNIVFGFNIFSPILYFMNFFPDDQSLLHDICVDLFNLIFLGCCSSNNSGIILWLK